MLAFRVAAPVVGNAERVRNAWKVDERIALRFRNEEQICPIPISYSKSPGTVRLRGGVCAQKGRTRAACHSNA
jgi:hypothetical protein